MPIVYYSLVRIAVEESNKLWANNVEFDLPRPSYTSHTLEVLKEQYPENEFSLILGEDNLRSFHKWKNHDELIQNYRLFVYPRVRQKNEIEDSENDLKGHPNVIMTQSPVMNISSSFIRNSIKEGKDVSYLLTPPVHDYIREMHFYE